MTNIEEILKKFNEEIQKVSDSYQTQRSIIEGLNDVTNTLLDTFTNQEDIAKKTEDVSKQYDDIIDGLKDVKTSVDDINKEYKDIPVKIKDITDELKNVPNEVKNISDELKKLPHELINTYKQLDSINKANANAFKAANDALKDFVDRLNNSNFDKKNEGGSDESDENKGSSKTVSKTKFSAIGVAGKMLGGIFKGAFDEMIKLQKSFNPLNAQMGYSFAQQQKFFRGMSEVSIKTAASFNKTSKDIAEIQGQAFQEMGRNVVFAGTEMEKLAGISKIMGSNSAAAGFVSSMDKVGLGSIRAAKQFENIMNVANKSGVSMTKAASLVQSNIQKAQTYGFRNGVESLTKMATQSLKMRMNMEQAFNFSDKNATIQSSVENSARMQVLGGSFSSFSNPIENLYNSLNDQNANMDKIIGLGENVMKFNKETGQVDFKSTGDRMMAKEFANINGLDFENLAQSWSRAATEKAITNDIRSGRTSIGGLEGFDEKGQKTMSDLVKSQAQWDNDLKSWVTSVYDKNAFGEGKGGYVNRQLDQLTAKDLENIMPQEQEIKTIARSTMDIKDILEGIHNALLQRTGLETYNAISNTLERMGTNLQKTLDELSERTGNASRTAQTLGGVTGLGIGSLGSGVFGRIFKQIPKMFRRGKGAGGGATGGTSWFSKILPGLKGVSKVIGKAAGPVAAVVEGGFTAYDNYKKGNFKKGSGKQNQAWGETAGAAVGGAVGGAVGAAALSFIPVVGTAIGGVVGGWLGAKGGAWLGKTVGKYLDKNTKTGRMIKTGVRYLPAVSQGVALVKLFKGDFKGALTELVTGTKVQVKMLKKGVEVVGKGVADAGKWIGDTSVMVWGKVSSWFVDKFDKFKKGLSIIWDTLTTPEGREKLKKVLVDKFTSLLHKIGDFFIWVWDQINPIKKIQDGWEGLKNGWNSAMKALASIDAESTKKANEEMKWAENGDDFVIPPNGRSSVIRRGNNRIMTNPNDVILAAKPGGALSNYVQTQKPIRDNIRERGYGNISINPIDIRLSGNLQISGGGRSINVSDLLVDRTFVSNLTNMVAVSVNEKMNTGKLNNNNKIIKFL